MTPHSKFLAYLLQGQHHLPIPPQDLLNQDKALRRVFCAAYLLADTRPGHDVGVFISQTLPRLLRQLSRTTERQRVTYQGEIRGRVDWPATTKARHQTEYNPSLFVCRQPHRQENTLENQLLKYLLVRLDTLLDEISPVVLMAERWTTEGEGETDWLLKRVHEMAYHLKATLGHVRMQAIEMPLAITSQHLLKTQTSKTELYGTVARLYGRYQAVIIHHQWQEIRPIIRHTLLLPSPDDPQGDLCIRLAVSAFIGN